MRRATDGFESLAGSRPTVPDLIITSEKQQPATTIRDVIK